MLVPPKCLQPAYERLIHLLRAGIKLAADAPDFGEYADAVYWIEQQYLSLYFDLALDSPVEWFLVYKTFLNNARGVEALPYFKASCTQGENWQTWLARQPVTVQQVIQQGYEHDGTGKPADQNPIAQNIRAWDDQRVTMEQARIKREQAVKEAEQHKIETKNKGGRKGSKNTLPSPPVPPELEPNPTQNNLF